MTRIELTDRMWVIGGAVIAALLLAIGWFLLIGPKLTEGSNLHAQADNSQVRVAALQQRLLVLQRQHDDLPRYQAQLAADRQALPDTPASSDFLRELQSVGDRTSVAITAISVSPPVQLAGANAQVAALPIVLTASGNTRALNEFLDQLQQKQARAVLVNSANLAPADAASAKSGTYTLSLNLRAFVRSTAASATGAEPAVTTD